MGCFVQEADGNEGDVDSCEGWAEIGHYGFEFVEGWGVEVERGGGVEGFEFVGDLAGFHYVGTVREFDAWGGVGPSLFVWRKAGGFVSSVV